MSSTLQSIIAGKQGPDIGTIYFGYGSNMWLDQMRRRCPASTYLGIARLNEYRWHINTRHYANVALASPHPSPEGREHVSWGLAYHLTPADEKALDVNEGVPIAYEKEYLPCDFWPSLSPGDGSNTSRPQRSDVAAAPVAGTPMLVYINRRDVTDSYPADEYIVRMNHAIHDGLEMGIPKDYVDEVMRKYIPEENPADEETKRLAAKNSTQFIDPDETIRRVQEAASPTRRV